MEVRVRTGYDVDTGVIHQTVNFGAYAQRWLIRTQERDVREALVALGWTPPATDIGDEVPLPLRDTSPGLREASELGGVPGPMQYKVLEALASNNNGCTAKEVARRVNKKYRSTHGDGTMKGAMSGMVNQRQRHWIYPGEKDTRNISDRGRKALQLGKVKHHGQ